MPFKIESAFEAMKPEFETRGDEMVKKIGHVYYLEVYEKKGGPT